MQDKGKIKAGKKLAKTLGVKMGISTNRLEICELDTKLNWLTCGTGYLLTLKIQGI